MNDLRTEFVDKQPGKITLVQSLVKMPTPLIRDGMLIKSFRGTTSGLSNPDSSFTKSSEQLRKINLTQTQPLLQLRLPAKVDQVRHGQVLVGRQSASDLAELLY